MIVQHVVQCFRERERGHDDDDELNASSPKTIVVANALKKNGARRKIQ